MAIDGLVLFEYRRFLSLSIYPFHDEKVAKVARGQGALTKL